MRSIVISSLTTVRHTVPLDLLITQLNAAYSGITTACNLARRRGAQLLLALTLSIGLVACDSNLQTETPGPPEAPGTPEAPEKPDPDNLDPLPPAGNNGTNSNDLLTLTVGNGPIQLTEGAATPTTIPVSIVRKDGASGTIQLSAKLENAANERYTSLEFSNATLGANETSSTLNIQLAIGARPIKPEIRTLIVTASDGAKTIMTTSIDFSVVPTSLPDVYLLVGQSNMVGFSEDNSKQAGPGELDAPNSRILQLNVTGNDGENFATAADFTDPAKNFNVGLPLTIAVDPLHDGFDSTLNGKAGERIGPALSFAKRALQDTTTDIYLVPAAWSDTGFCKRDTNRFPGSGWNATEKNDDALSGTLLYDRAVTRANIALEQTNGVLRGILWHQGEADSDDADCAASYADNLVELAAALRTNIQADARGAIARGETAELPFIVGTMSQGTDERDAIAPFSKTKQLVDDTHRNIANLIPLSDVVINDDLLPSSYPCGEGSCIHFGAAAYREMGVRYYETLIRLLP